MICPKCGYEACASNFHALFKAIHGLQKWRDEKVRNSCPMCGHEFERVNVTKAACIEKLGWDAVKRAVFEHTRLHWDFPCFCDESCPFFSPMNFTCICQYTWPELKEKRR